MNIAVAAVTEYSAAKRITLSKKVKYDGGFTAMFSRKPKKIEEPEATIWHQRIDAPILS